MTSNNTVDGTHIDEQAKRTEKPLKNKLIQFRYNPFTERKMWRQNEVITRSPGKNSIKIEM